jgi:hypothetical protein
MNLYAIFVLLSNFWSNMKLDRVFGKYIDKLCWSYNMYGYKIDEPVQSYNQE